jgi:translation initiation factor 3 subunit K
MSELAYEISTAKKLEENVLIQLNNKSYDFETNKALLKNYQVNHNIANVDVVSNILILSIMRMPSSDFLSLNYLIPIK